MRQLSFFSRYPSLGELEGLCRQCSQCNLRQGCKQVVFGEGNPEAELLFIGEAPGAQEDELGRPFVGAAGQLLEKILAAVGFKREEVYITNVVKCRPPGNRLPVAEEIAACRPHLEAQIELINPLIIVCLGALAAQTLIKPSLKITQVRGQWVEKNGIRIMPTYHPAALLRDESKKKPLWEDFKEVKKVYTLLTQKTDKVF